MKISFGLALSLALVACSSPPDQVITGHVAPGFPSQITSIRVIHNGAVVATSPVATDGSFLLSVAPSKGLALQLVGGGKDQVVFPRQGPTTQIRTTFAVRSGGVAFDLGAIHYVGLSAASVPLAFHNGPAATDCEDGHDAGGNTCVDDGDSDAQTCGADEEDDTESGESADDSNDGTDDVDDDLADEGDAVAEHNFPADGCADDDNETNDD
jgi:hypothetical protein